MIKVADADKLKGDFSVYFNGEYVVLSGTKLFILRPDGSLVARRDDLHRSQKITFFPQNRVLLCTGKAVFHMIDLRDGSDIWSAPYIRNNLNRNNLAVSPDGEYAYTFDENRYGKFIARLHLNSPGHEVDAQEMQGDIGATCDIACDEDGVPCLLKTLTETVGGKRLNQCGVRMHDYDGIAPGSTTTWKTKWSFEQGRTAEFFFDGTDRVITGDYYLYEPATGKLTDLLEKEESWERSGTGLLACWKDVSGRYLCLGYDNRNVIIDLQERKIAAQYASSWERGCLIGDRYWLCVDKKILRKPFPAFEELPPRKKVIGMDWYYAQHPERW